MVPRVRAVRCSLEGGGELQEGAGALAGGMQAGCRAGGVEVAQRGQGAVVPRVSG